mgnify:CR=1 FL=1
MAGRKSIDRVVLILITLAFLGYSVFVRAQSAERQQPTATQVGQPPQEETIPKDIADRMAKERLKNRYDILKRDSEKLLELATELKQYVDKSGDNVMSLEVIRKCDEIEKLSKSVRSKMKGN